MLTSRDRTDKYTEWKQTTNRKNKEPEKTQGWALKKYWEDYRAGKVELRPNHGMRGKDKPETIRPIQAQSKSLAVRYYERTGRRLDKEMADEQKMIEMLMNLAMESDDKDDAFDKLNQVRRAQSEFNSKWAPFLEQKLDTKKSNEKIEDTLTLDDVLNGETKLVEDSSDGNLRIEEDT